MRPVFWLAAMSPYAWLSAERIGALIPGARWRPVFAGALFKANGRVSWGITDARAAGIAACDARAAEHGLGPIVWPDPWPTNDVTIARAMVAADDRGALRPFALAAMRLCFKEGVDLGERAAAAEAARRVGLDPDEIVAAIDDPGVKRRLRANNDDAVARGIFGVPTVTVGDELFWGDDRLAEAATSAAGTTSSSPRPRAGRASGSAAS